MRALENVPDPLKQKFLPLDNSYEIEYAKHIYAQEGYDLNVKYLMDCTGEFTNFAVFCCANKLVLRKIHDAGLETQFIFSEELVVQDVEYMRRADAGFDLVVTLNSAKLSLHPHCVALLHWTGAQLKQLRKLRIDDEICCVKAIADEVAMEQLESLLHPRMSSWPHIIAVGTRLAHCYLLHFQLSDRQHDDGHTPVTVKLTDGLKPFHSGDKFVYTWMDHCTGSSQAKSLPLETVYVTCISFLEKSRTVLVGFSFGGIMTISLTDHPTIDPLVYPCSAAVQFIATLEPDDDPRCHLWFFVAYGPTKVKPLQLCLYEVMFPEEEALPLSERTWNTPVFNIKLMIPFPHTIRWVSAQTLVRDRAELRASDDSTRDSYRIGSDKDRSLMFFSYIANDRHGYSLKGGLFDLNAYYYKRLVQVIIPDGTLAQQSAFLSNVHPIPIHHKEEDFSLIKDLAVDTACLTRFISNVSDAEQMFYPSTYEIFVVHVAGAKKCHQLTLPSLPNQLLSTICTDLEMHMADPSSASAWLLALGFPKRDLQYERTEPHAKLCSVLSALISHQRAMSIVQFIRHSESTESRYFIANWIWEEIDRASKKMHETIEPLFARFSAPLSPAGRKSLAHVHDVFVAGVQILRELISSGEREQDATKEYMTSLEAQRFATENLRSYSAVIHQFIRSKILPVAEDREIRVAMEEAVQERRAKTSGHMLYIDKLVARMQSRSKNEPFWLVEGPKWYPPALLNLLGPILLLHISTKSKGQLLAYYLLDYAYCKKTMEPCLYSSLNLIDVVATQMHGLLGMNKEELGSVYRSWCADAKMPLPNESGIELCSPPRRIFAENDIKQLMCIPRPLSAEEEEKLRTLTKSARFGEFAWQCYLIRNKRYEHFTELSVPLNENNEFVVDYHQLLPVVRMILRNRSRSLPLNISWPPGVKEAIEKFEEERNNSNGWYDSSMPIFNRGRTPKPLNRRQLSADVLVSRKRHGNTLLQQINSSSSQLSTKSDKSESIASKRALLDFSEDESVPLPKNIPADTLSTIADILRTPQTRARAAAQAESQRKWTQKTPESEFQKPAPRSILKSARAPSERAASPSRNRLQFDLPSLSQSSLSQTNSEAIPVERMTQPNFDESLEYEENIPGSAATGKIKVVKEKGHVASYVSPASSIEAVEFLVENRDFGDVLEKSIEIQDEDDDEKSIEEGVDVVEQQDEETEMDINEVSEVVREAINKRKQTISEEWHRREVIEEVNESFEEKQDEEEEEELAEIVEESGEQIEKQDEQELWEEEKLQSIEQEEQDEIDIVEEVMSEKPSKIVEVQDEDITTDAVNIMRYESVVEKRIEMASVSGQHTCVTEECGHITRSVKICSQIDDDVAVAEIHDEYEEDLHSKTPSSDSVDDAKSSSDRIATAIDSTAADLNAPSESHVKLVDYSFGESSLECTPASKRFQKAVFASLENSSRKELHLSATNDDEDDAVANAENPSIADELGADMSEESPLREPVHEEVHLGTVAHPSSEPYTNQVERSQSVSASLTKHDDLPALKETVDFNQPIIPSIERPITPPLVEQEPSETVSPGRLRPSKSVRVSAPPVPVRHSQRLKEKAAESHLFEAENDKKAINSALETAVGRNEDVDEPRTPSPTQKADETSHLTMSLRSRTHASSEAAISQNSKAERSPGRSRKAAKDIHLAVSENASQTSKTDEADDTGVTIPTRTLRPRTPTRSKQETFSPVSAAKIPRTPRRVSESSATSDITMGSTRKSPSRATRSRKLSATEEEPPVSAQKSPSRRMLTHSSSSFKSESESAAKSKGVKALHQKLGTGTDLFEGMDPRTYFDKIMKKHTSVASGSRRRTRSDSEVPEVKTMKLKKMKLEETIQEADEEADASTSQGRTRSSTQRTRGHVEAGTTGSASRPRRASSATPAKPSPGRTRRTSGSSASSVGGTATPKSPSRRGRPRGIGTIAE